MQCVIFAIKLSKRFLLIICKLIKVKSTLTDTSIYLENRIEINMSRNNKTSDFCQIPGHETINVIIMSSEQ